MSRFVDERVVEMDFDNKNFESNVKTSMSTIEKLKESLDFSGVAGSIESNFGGIDTSSLINNLSKASEGFGVLEVAAITAIAKITDKVIDLGLQLVKSLSTDNIAAGWSQFGSIAVSEATLLAQGLEQSKVDRTLDLFRWYADETSHSVTGLVNNLGKFTAAGISLETAEQSMIGIANWASMSGKEAGDAVAVMEALAKSIGKGSVSLREWQSVTIRNMDTLEFKEKILEAALAMGDLNQSIDGSYLTKGGKTFKGVEDFQTMLSEGWLTSDVLNKVLNDYAGATMQIYDIMQNDSDITTASQAFEKYGDILDARQKEYFLAAQEARTFQQAIQSVKDAVSSGWSNIFTNIFGQVNEAKVLWTKVANELYDVFMGGIWKVIDVTSEWAEMGGRDHLFARTEEQTGAFWHLFDAVIAIKDLISKAWSTIFPMSEMEEEGEQITDLAEKLYSFTEKLQKMTEKLFLSEESAEKLSNIFQGLFSVIKLIGKAIKALWIGIEPIRNLIGELFGKIFSFFSDAGKGITEFTKTTDIFERAGVNIANFFTKVIDKIKSFGILEKVIGYIKSFITIIKKLNVLEKVAGAIEFVKSSVKSLFEQFQNSGGTTDNFKKILDGVKAAFELIKRAITAVLPSIKDGVVPAIKTIISSLIKFAGILGGVSVKIFAFIGETISWFNNFTKTSATWKKTVDVIKSIFTGLINFIKNIFSSFKKVDTSGVDNVSTDVVEKFNPLTVILSALGKVFTGLWNVVKSLVPLLGKALTFIGNALGVVASKISSLFKDKDGIFRIEKLFSAAFWATALVGILKVVSTFRTIGNALSDIVEGFAKVLDSKAMMQYAEALKSFAIAILIVVAAVVLLSLVDENKLESAMMTIITMVGVLLLVMAAMKKIFAATDKFGIQSITASYAMKQAADGMQTMAISLLLMTASLMLIASMKQDEIMRGVFGIIALLGVLLGAAAIVGKNKKTFNAGAKGLIKMSIAVLLLTIPLKKLGEMKAENLLKGIAAIGALILLVTIFAKATSNIKNSLRTSVLLVSLSTSLLLAMIPFIVIGKMNWESIGKAVVGLTAIGLILFALVGISKLIKPSLKTILSMSMLVGVLTLAVIPFILLGKLSWEAIGKATVGIAAILGVLVLLSAVSKVLKSSILGAVTLNLVATSLLIAVIPFVILANLGWKKLAVGVVGIVAIAAVLAGLAALSGQLSKALLAAGTLALIAGSIMIFAMAIVLMGSMSWEGIGKAAVVMLTIIGVIALVVVASKLLSGVIPTFLAFAIAVGVMGAGILLLATGLSLLGVIFTTSSSIIVTALKNILVTILSLVPQIIEILGSIIKGMVDLIITLIPSIVGIISELMAGVIKIIGEQGPALIQVIVELVVALLQVLAENFPAMAESLVSMLFTLLDTIKKYSGELVESLFNIVINMIKGLSKKIPQLMKELTILLKTILDSSVKFIIDSVPMLVNSAFDLVIGIIDGLGLALKNNAPKLRKSIDGFLSNVWDAILSFFNLKKDDSSLLSSFINMGQRLMDGLVAGVKKAWNNLKDAGDWIVKIFKEIFGIKSPSTVFAEIGDFVMLGFIQGMESESTGLKKAMNNIGDEAADGLEHSGITGAINKVKSLIENGMDDQLTLRPIMDLSDIQNGTDQIYGMLQTVDGYSIKGSNELAKKTYKDVETTGRSRERASSKASESAVGQTNPESSIFNNTFNITGSNPKAIAEEVSREMKKQSDRSRAKWGK